MSILDIFFDAADCVFNGVGAACEYVCENPVKTIAVIGATVVTGGVALAAAPAIATSLGGAGMLGAASTGTTISSLSGAALTNASLAAIGGGSVATGGAGIAGGATIIAGAGALTGGGIATVCVKEET